MLRVQNELFAQMTRWLERAYPGEGCGLMLGTTDGETRTVAAIVEAANLNTERAADRFELDPAAFLEADEIARAEGIDVIGIFHSHPDCPPQASQFDQERAWAGYSYLIVSVVEGASATHQSWVLDGERFIEEPVEVVHG
ncbi:MAG: M67 family metallopeptidase [Myxococcales bacterium]|nr:M67 family metallopeptidase [Myxococcales bacterium]